MKVRDWLTSKEVWVILIESIIQILERFAGIELIPEEVHLTITGVLLLVLRVFFTKDALSFFGINRTVTKE